MNKKGDYIVLETTIFIILNLVFFVTLLIFVSRSSEGIGMYNEKYAKEIAVIIDNSEPGTSVFLDIQKGFDIAEKNKKDINKIFSITDNVVQVSLAGEGFASFKTFSRYKTSLNIQEISGRKKLLIEVRDE